MSCIVEKVLVEVLGKSKYNKPTPAFSGDFSAAFTGGVSVKPTTGIQARRMGVEVFGKSPSRCQVSRLSAEVLGRLNPLPPTLIPNLGLWLNNQNIVATNNEVISIWRDSSGNDRHAVSWEARNPTYLTKAFNGQPVVHFSAGKILRVYHNFGASTIFMLGRMTGSANFRMLSGLGNNWLFGWHAGYMHRAYFENWISMPYTPTDTNFHLYTGALAGGSTQLYHNGDLIASGGYGQGPQGLALGGTVIGLPGEESDCEIAELIIYDRVLSDSERMSVENYLKLKFGLAPIVDLVSDMSTVQGYKNLYYGYTSNPDTPNDFSTNTMYWSPDANQWQAVTSFFAFTPWISATSIHPPALYDTRTYGVKRWVSNVNRRIRIIGQSFKDNNIGDGVEFTVRKNGKVIYRRYLPAVAPTLPYSLSLSVLSGDIIDWVISSGIGTVGAVFNGDLTNFSGKVLPE